MTANACWTLVIAATTYTTLVHPFSRCTAWLESPYAFLVVTGVILVVALTPSIAVTAVYDMVNAGGLCWLRSGTRSAQLTLFVPRAFALVGVISLYVRLFIFFRRRDVGILDSTSDRRDPEDDDDARGAKRLSVASLSARLAVWNRRRSSDTIYQPTPQYARPSVPLDPIPGSPVQFNESFSARSRNPAVDSALLAARDDDERISPSTTPLPTPSFLDEDAVRNERKASATVSFSGLDPSSSDGSSPDLPGGASHPTSSLTPSSRSKRLSSGAPPRTSDTRRGDRGGVGVGSGGGTGSQSGGNHQGSRTRRMSLTPRQVNKRLSLLMAVFPLAYCALVAVAVARLIQEISTRERAPTGLLWTSRFLINSMGLIDGVLYVFVQVAFRWWVKRDST